MKKVNALQLRQSLGAVIKKLQSTGEPILVEKGREAVAVLVSLSDYKKRFVDVEADILRKDFVANIRAASLELPNGTENSLDLLRSLRNGKT